MNFKNYLIKSGAIIAVLFLVALLAWTVIDRHQQRQQQLKELDGQNLQHKINQVEVKTLDLLQAVQLFPVWKNWAEAKKIALEFGLEFSATQADSRRNSGTWVGTLSGEPLLVLAVAKRIQQEIAAEIVEFHHLGVRARLDIAVLGTADK